MSKIIVRCMTRLAFAPLKPCIKADGTPGYKEKKVYAGNEFPWLGDPKEIPPHFKVIEGAPPAKRKVSKAKPQPERSSMTQKPDPDKPVTAGGMSGLTESGKTHD